MFHNEAIRSGVPLGGPMASELQKEIMGYPLLITGHDNRFRARFPDFPNVTASGSSIAEVMERAAEALELHLEAVQWVRSGQVSTGGDSEE
ncbi:MAG: hypothetical protein GMKNLPBB_02326 [Myxococcota bacterium]|nr:hypothetical protein [Myxococcota bacterium]